jgi:hypothetical protein
MPMGLILHRSRSYIATAVGQSGLGVANPLRLMVSCHSMSAVMSPLSKSPCFYILLVSHDLMYIQYIQMYYRASIGAVEPSMQ